MPTDYAISKGAAVWKQIGATWWWTRTRGDINTVVCVQGEGKEHAIMPDLDFSCIRPVLWINLESVFLK